MKKLSLILLIACVVGCKGNTSQVIQTTYTDTEVNGYTIRIFKYEGCEYILMGNGNAQAISHKGNCNNPIHKQQVQLK